MHVKTFLDILAADFYAGVPDSQLRPLCDCLMDAYGLDPRRHIIAASEGTAAALAAGYHLATGRVPVVYLQNSGEGNLVNPAASLLHREVYGIPVILIVGWRGQPGVRDEPQHIFQGKITEKLLHLLDISTFAVKKDTTEAEILAQMEVFRQTLRQGGQVAFLIEKGALEFGKSIQYRNENTLSREAAIRQIVAVTGGDPIVSTTGKASRELYEIREANRQPHDTDFLTVGSMGHASAIALGIALQRPEKRVWCLDGDGAALMHLGAMAAIGAAGPENLIHVVLNNEAHESVGGMPTAAGRIDLPAIARACGYGKAASVSTPEALAQVLAELPGALTFLEVKCTIGARADLGRPTLPPQIQKEQFARRLANASPEV